MLVRASVLVILGVSVASLGACGAEAGAPPPNGAGSGGSFGFGTGGGVTSCGGPEFPCAGGSFSAGGVVGAGGGASAGGSVGGAGNGAGGSGTPGTLCADKSVCTIELCPGANIVNLPLDTFAPCQMVGCNNAHCVPIAAIPAEVPIDLLGKCADPTTACVPDDYTASFGKFQAKSCESILGAEGRCISTCVPQVNGLMDALPQGDCGANERCAPCINPNDGTDTGACSQGCDPGPDPATTSNPILFDDCQVGGACVPKSIIPKALLSHLIQYECPSADLVCAPRDKTQNLKYNFPKCIPGVFGGVGIGNPDGQLGGCVPAWLVDGNPFEGGFIDQGNCPAGQKCAPCHNPLRPDPTDPTGQTATGACPIPLPTDPSGGLPPDGGTGPGGGTGGAGGTTGAGGTAASGGAPSAGGTLGAGGQP